MSKYIELDTLKNAFSFMEKDKMYHLDKRFMDEGLDYFVTKKDIVEVVRCKDCKYRSYEEKEGHYCLRDSWDQYDRSRKAENDEWFCADGERRE